MSESRDRRNPTMAEIEGWKADVERAAAKTVEGLRAMGTAITALLDAHPDQKAVAAARLRTRLNGIRRPVRPS